MKRSLLNNFLIRDIIAEDISLILGQRADFSSIISKEGIEAIDSWALLAPSMVHILAIIMN